MYIPEEPANPDGRNKIPHNSRENRRNLEIYDIKTPIKSQIILLMYDVLYIDKAYTVYIAADDCKAVLFVDVLYIE